MSYTSFPFENQSTNEDQYSKLFREFQRSGVSGGYDGGQCAVTANSTGMKVTISAGVAVVRGHCFWATTSNDVTIAAAGAQQRVDAVVLRLDPTANSITPAIVQGVGGALPVLSQTDTGVYEHLLAYVTVAAGAVTIAPGDVSDMRNFMGKPTSAWRSAARPTSPLRGQAGYNVDTGAMEFWGGTGWSSYWGAADAGWTDLAGFASGVLIRPQGKTPGYKVLSDPVRRVKLRGQFQAGSQFATGGVTIIGALPNEIWPSAEVQVIAATNYSGSVTANARWEILPSGILKLYCGTGITWASLDDIEYEI